jgi:hypothetical protein
MVDKRICQTVATKAFVNCLNSNILLLLLLKLQPTVDFSILSDFLPFHPFLTQLSPPPYSHYLYIFLDVLNQLFLALPLLLLPVGFNRYSFTFHPPHVTQPNHSFSFYKSQYTCVSAFFLRSISS